MALERGEGRGEAEVEERRRRGEGRLVRARELPARESRGARRRASMAEVGRERWGCPLVD